MPVLIIIVFVVVIGIIAVVCVRSSQKKKEKMLEDFNNTLNKKIDQEYLELGFKDKVDNLQRIVCMPGTFVYLFPKLVEYLDKQLNISTLDMPSGNYKFKVNYCLIEKR